MVDKFGRKQFFGPKAPVKTDEAQKNYPLIIIPSECCVVYQDIISLSGRHSSSGNRVDRKVPSLTGTPKMSRQPFAEAVVYRSGSYALPQLSSYRESSDDGVLRHHAI